MGEQGGEDGKEGRLEKRNEARGEAGGGGQEERRAKMGRDGERKGKRG